MDINSKIYVAGHNGMVGSAIVRKLTKKGFNNLILRDSKKLDLRNELDVELFFKTEKPDYVFLAAALVGGIQANIDNPAKFLFDNLKIQNNVIHSSYVHNVKRLLFLGSSCIYPRDSIQPMKEEYLLTGKLEPTNEGYALAKIAGLKLVEFYNKQYGTKYLSVMPSNIYGENDNFDPKHSHVVSASISRIIQALKNESDSITIWGDGSARREFMYVDDLADSLLFLIEHYFEDYHINIGVGYDISILELNELICKIVGFKGKINLDINKPNGIPQKLLDVSKLHNLGWKHSIDLEEGIRKTIDWYNEVKSVKV
jgi:GDP-L-fucose synthase